MSFQLAWGNGLTNQNPPLALHLSTFPIPSHIPLTWHSGTEVVTSDSKAMFAASVKPLNRLHGLIETEEIASAVILRPIS
jgi:hypothetical protein